MTHSQNLYAVQLTSRANPRKRFLALNAIGGHGVGPRLFYFRAEAIGAKNALAAGGGVQARVVKVRVTYHWPANFPSPRS